MNLKEYLAMKYAPSKYPIISKLPLGYNSPKIQMGNTIGVTRNAVVVNPLTGYNVSTGNVMQQFANSSVSNLVTNGDFANGLVGWTVSASATMLVNNGIAEFICSAYNNYIMQTTTKQQDGDKIYCRANVKSTSSQVYLQYYDGVGVSRKYHTGSNNFEKLSLIATQSVGATICDYRIKDERYSGWNAIYVDDFIVINLSKTFGYGLEPSLAWCDANIPFFTVTLSNPPWVKPLVTHGGYGYVGGDTTELIFDFGTKVASSVVECPMKAYRNGTSNALEVPTGSWAEWTSQSDIDLFKTQDGSVRAYSTTVNGAICQFLIELDLTPVANQLFGGSNSALKSALKSINVDVWAMGSGSNGGVTTNGLNVKAWLDTAWNTGWNYTGSTVGKVTTSPLTNNLYITTSNKVYFLVSAQYPSDGSITSSVSLDYARITIGLNRTVDTVTPKSVMLPKYFGMFFKGVAQNFVNPISNAKIIGMLYKDESNRIDLRYDQNTNKISCYYRNNVGSSLILNGSTIGTAKYQVINSFITYNGSTLSLYELYNNGTMQKFTTSATPFLTGAYLYYPSVAYTGGVQSLQGDSFAESFTIYDIESLGRSSTKNMFKGNFINGSINYNGNPIGYPYVYGVSTIRLTLPELIPVQPNTTYTLTIPSGFLGALQEYDVNKGQVLTNDGGWKSTSQTLTTNANTRYLNIYFAYVAGTTIVPSNANGIVQLELGSVTTPYEPYSRAVGFTDYEVESILRGENKYYQTTTSDFTGKVSGSVVENPNIAKHNMNGSQTSLIVPSSFSTEVGSSYSLISTLNGSNLGITTSVNSAVAQTLFSFNLIEIVKRKYGSVPGTNVAEQVAWLKANINTLNFNWHGYGSCPSGNKAFIDMWSVANSRWEYRANNDYSKINNSSSPSLISISKGTSGGYAGVIISNAIDNNGFVHYLSLTDSSNGTVASTIYSDYCSLDVTVKTGNTSAYVPQRELFDINAVTLHANATRSNGVITLNANGLYQTSDIYISVLPNNRYTFKFKKTGTRGYADIREFYNNTQLRVINGILGDTLPDGEYSIDFVTGNNANKLRILLLNSATGTFTFSDTSLKIKM